MNFKKIISGLAAGTVAAALSVSAFAASPTVTWSNGTNVVPGGNSTITSTGTLSEAITTNANIEFDLLLKGASGNSAYLAFMSGKDKAFSIERAGWSSVSYTVGDNEVISYSDSDKESELAAHHFVVTLDFDKDEYSVIGTKSEGNTNTVTGELTSTSIDSLALYAKCPNKYTGNEATITNLTITTADAPTPAAVNAEKVSPELTEGETTRDAVGFKATIPAQSTAGKVVWNVKKDASSDAVTVDGGATEVMGTEIIVGLLITDVPADADVDGMAATVTVE